MSEPRRSSRPRKPKSTSDSEDEAVVARDDSGSEEADDSPHEKTPKRRGRPAKVRESPHALSSTPTLAATPSSSNKRRKGLASNADIITLVRQVFQNSKTKPTEADLRAELTHYFGEDWYEKKEFIMDVYLSFS